MARVVIGDMRERVGIQPLATTDDGIGGQSATWATSNTTWASVEPLIYGEREREVGGQLVASMSYRVHMRYRTGLTPKARLQWRGRTLEINGLVDSYQSGKRFLTLDCIEVQLSGSPARP